MRNPIERRPKVTLPVGWHARSNYGIPYKVSRKGEHEDWYTVARKFGVGVNELIFFNFLTTDPDEVNWYLHHHTGCKKVSPSGNNWMFSRDANPGIIYIPPAEDRKFEYEGEHSCAWWWPNTEEFIKQLQLVASSMAKNQATKNRGSRIKKLVNVIIRVEYPYCLKLWYYNDMNVTAFADVRTSEPQLREMTKETQPGTYPFTGKSGLYSQSGPSERHRGYWQIHPIQELFDKFCGKPWDPDVLAEALVNIDEYMYKGWHALSRIDGIAGGAGGNAYSDLQWDFAKHVQQLSQDPDHLYHAFN